jgi:hypothetical protein
MEATICRLLLLKPDQGEDLDRYEERNHGWKFLLTPDLSQDGLKPIGSGFLQQAGEREINHWRDIGR